MRIYKCDLHVHTCLSPCADLDMHPKLLIQRAIEANIDFLGICDHNSAENVPYVMQAALGKNIKILPGMELTTKEEVHILAFFDGLSDLFQLQKTVYEQLPGKNDEKRFGVQAVVNEKAEVEWINDRFLIGATKISLNEAVALIHRLNGLAVAAHIDRENFSVISQLGFISAEMHFDALEVSGNTSIKQAREKYRNLAEFSIITSSDAHFPGDIGFVSTGILMKEPSFAELKMAFQKESGRMVVEG